MVWRTDLRATKRHWRGWFEGMSTAFLELSMPKVRILLFFSVERVLTFCKQEHAATHIYHKLTPSLLMHACSVLSEAAISMFHVQSNMLSADSSTSSGFIRRLLQNQCLCGGGLYSPSPSLSPSPD